MIEDIHRLEDEVTRLKAENDYMLDCYIDLINVHARLLIKSSDRTQIDRHLSDYSTQLGHDVISDLRDMLNLVMKVERQLAGNKLRAVA